MTKPKQPKPESEDPEVDPLAAIPVESHIPDMPVVPAQPSKAPERDRKNVEHKIIHNDQGGVDEILIGYSEIRDLPDEPLTDEMELLGHAYEAAETPSGELGQYQTEVMNSTMGGNLLIYPAIAAGRCTRCGPTRFVDKKNGTRGEVWKVVNRKNGEFRFVYRKGDWVEIHAANCPHYRKVHIHCSYCGEPFTGTKDQKGSFTETLASRILWVFAERNAPNRLIMVCADFRCKSKFDEQYHLNQKL